MPEPEAAVAIVHAQGPEESVLLIRRTEREEDPWSGHWSFPGGRHDREDRDLLDTALRELAEECGIQLAREQMELALPPTNAGRRLGHQLLVAPFLFRVREVLGTDLDPREAAEALWIPLRWLRDPARHTLLPVPRLPKDLAFPAIDLAGAPLWGFTYRVITEWLGLHPRQSSTEDAGFVAACDLLEFLLAQGLALRHGWSDPEPGARNVRKVASVEGEIPVSVVLRHFSEPRTHFPGVNAIEVRSDHARVVGLALEEYLIQAG